MKPTRKTGSHDIAIHEARQYPELVTFLETSLGFLPLELSGGASIAGKITLLIRLAKNFMRLVLYSLSQSRSFDTVVTFSHLGIVLRFLRLLNVIRYKRSYNMAFFLHSPKWIGIMRFFLFDSLRDNYIVFSRQEIDLYSTTLHIDRDRLHYLPYCSWNEAPSPAFSARIESNADYYFAGGYSNRDYSPLIAAFRNVRARLLIIGSRHNLDLAAAELPPNVECLYDVPSDVFETYVANAKAGIISLKYDTGACGQSVILRLMRNRKVVIANDMHAIRDYIEDGVTGFLLQDIALQLPALVATLEGTPDRTIAMGNAAHDLFLRRFSREAGAAALTGILREADMA